MAKKETPKARITDIDFVKAYASSENVRQAAARLGISSNAVATRAASLRKKGVGLPHYARARRVVDIAGLNDLFKKRANTKPQALA